MSASLLKAMRFTQNIEHLKVCVLPWLANAAFASPENNREIEICFEPCKPAAAIGKPRETAAATEKSDVNSEGLRASPFPGKRDKRQSQIKDLLQ